MSIDLIKKKWPYTGKGTKQAIPAQINVVTDYANDIALLANTFTAVKFQLHNHSPPYQYTQNGVHML